MKTACIKSVELKALDPTKMDRRGTIAIFHLDKAPNWQYIQHKALNFLWTLTSMLSDYYQPRTYEELTDKHYMSEGNECWITPGAFDEERYQIRLSHKYWSRKQVECFREMVRSLAKLHGWKVLEEREVGTYLYRCLPVTESGWCVIGFDHATQDGGVLEW